MVTHYIPDSPLIMKHLKDLPWSNGWIPQRRRTLKDLNEPGGIHRIQKLIGLVLLSLFITLGLAACGAPKNDSASSLTSQNVTSPEATQVTLDVWHVWTTVGDGNAVAFKKVLAAYEADHPNVTINALGNENEAYKSLIRTAMSANEIPDVFFSWGAGFARPFVESGRVAVITDYLSEDALQDLHPNAGSNFTYDDNLYGLPFISWMGILYCNEDMFRQAGVKVPDTMDDLYMAINAFNDRGIVPISVGAKDAWDAMFFQNVATIRTAGINASKQALNKEISFNQKAFIEGNQLVIDMVEAGAFDPNCLALTYDEAKMVFLNGESPMIYQGSWFAAEIQNPEISKVAGKIVAKNFPALEGGAYNNEFLGGAIDGLMLSETSTNKEVAADFIAYITEGMSRESFLLGSGLPVWEIDVEGEAIDPLVKEIVELSENSDGYLVAWDTYLTGTDAIRHLALVQEIFAKLKSAEAFAQEMDALKQ